MSSQGLSLQASLLRYLNKIQMMNSALKFCDLVLNADYLINHSRVPRKEDANCKHVHSDIDSVWKQLKAEINPKRLVALKILQILHVKEDTSDITRKFVSLLSQIDEVKFDVKNHLIALTSATNSLTASSITGHFNSCYSGFCTEPNTKNIYRLKVYLYMYRMDKTKKLLFAMCWINPKEQGFTDKEKNEIGSLLSESIGAIKFYIDYTISMATRKLKSDYLKLRSALQFFTEIYAKFPVGDKTLEEVADMAIINKRIKALQSVILELLDNYEAYETDSDYEDDFASEMPPSHTWWLKYKRDLSTKI